MTNSSGLLRVIADKARLEPGSGRTASPLAVARDDEQSRGFNRQKRDEQSMPTLRRRPALSTQQIAGARQGHRSSTGPRSLSRQGRAARQPQHAGGQCLKDAESLET